MSSEGAGAMGEEKNEKLALVPRLRFQIFLSEQDWVPRCLGEIARFSSGGTPSKDEPSYWNGSIPWISASSMYETRIVDSELKVTTSAIGNGTRIAPKGSLLVLVRGSMLFNRVPIGIAAVDVAFNQDVKALSISGDANSNFLLYQLIAASPGIPVNETGIGAGKIETDVLAGLPIYLPSPNEQQKIADCLSSLDDLITAETEKLDALMTHKKGLMQQLFPREGETVPRLRFPEFREAEEWEEKLIEDFFDVGSSKRVLQEEWTTQGVPFYRTRELVSLSKKEPFGSEIFISEALFREISEKYGLPAEGDFLVSGVGTLGISYQVQAQDRFYFKDGNVLWFKLRGGIVSTFFKYCFEADEIQNQILAQASISTVGTYTIQNAKVTKFSCPTNIKEQQEIADCLSPLDDLITVQSLKIDTLKAHKRGLMQQLFPVLEEVPA